MTPEKAKNIIRGCLNTHGFSLLPKSDGRVEIPRKVIQLLPWKDVSEIYLFETYGGLVASLDPEYDTTNVGKIIINQGRVRLSYGSLKKVGLDYRELIASINEDASLLIRSGFVGTVLYRAISEIPDEVALNIANALMGQKFVNNKQEVTKEKAENYKLILPNTRKPIIFRPLCQPYRFAGCWNDGEILIGGSSNTNSQFYLIGGLEQLGVGQTQPGYLLATDVLYDLLRAARVRAEKHRMLGNMEWIIKFDPSIREEFRIFNSPVLNTISNKKGKQLNNNYSSFLFESFRNISELSGKVNISNPPLVINNINYLRGKY